MLLDPAHSRLELADRIPWPMTEVWYSITARRSPTICSLNSLRVDRISEATSARSECMSARSKFKSDCVAISDRTSPSSARIWRRSSRMRLSGSSVIERF